MRKIRLFLIRLLANGDPIALNLNLLQGLYFDGDTKNLICENVSIKIKAGLPKNTGVYFD